MLALVMAAAWSDYLIGFFGYCLIKNYDVSIGALADPLHPYAGPWPPAKIGPGRVFPGAAPAAAASSAPLAGAASSTTGNNLQTTPGPSGPVFGGPR